MGTDAIPHRRRRRRPLPYVHQNPGLPVDWEESL